jgi:hypothetical protein
MQQQRLHEGGDRRAQQRIDGRAEERIDPPLTVQQPDQCAMQRRARTHGAASRSNRAAAFSATM